MAPNTLDQSYPSKDICEVEKSLVKTQPPDKADSHNEKFFKKSDVIKKRGLFEFETEIIWPNTIGITLLHTLAVYSILTFDYMQNWKTLVWFYFTYFWAGFGVTGGIHRYWTHRSYKATKPFQIFLVICYAIAGQTPIYYWVRDHRVHHKYTDSPADPHDSTRGLFFSHVGWLMLRKRPEVIEKGNQIDMTDIEQDPIVQFVDRHFNIIKILGTVVIPSVIPVIGWNETPLRSFISQAIIRYTIMLNCTWSVNSIAHAWGYKPYNKNIKSSENLLVSLFAGGEGWHNYHHAFPWDYNASEWNSAMVNMTGVILRIFEKLGLVYDLKQPSSEMVKRVASRTGDGSYNYVKEAPHPDTQVTSGNF